MNVVKGFFICDKNSFLQNFFFKIRQNIEFVTESISLSQSVKTESLLTVQCYRDKPFIKYVRFKNILNLNSGKTEIKVTSQRL